MAAYYKQSPTGHNEIAISQRTLTFTAGLVALLGALFSAGISYGVMRTQLAEKVDREAHAASHMELQRQLDRSQMELRQVSTDLQHLKSDVAETKQRTTDIACDLIRPRRTYCR